MSSTHKKPSELFNEKKMMLGILAKNNEGWEKRFDYKFPDGLFGVEWYSNRSFKCCWSETLDVKSFIRSERLLDLKEERTRIAGILRTHPISSRSDFRPLEVKKLLLEIAARLESEGDETKS